MTHEESVQAEKNKLSRFLTTHEWLELSPELRAKLKEIFNIPRSANTHVSDGVVLTDGYTHNDLKALSVEKMQEYTGLETDDFVDLFNAVIDKVLAVPVVHVDQGIEPYQEVVNTLHNQITDNVELTVTPIIATLNEKPDVKNAKQAKTKK